MFFFPVGMVTNVFLRGFGSSDGSTSKKNKRSNFFPRKMANLSEDANGYEAHHNP